MSALSIRLQLASIGILAVACAALARVVMDEIDNPPGGRAGGPPPQVAAPGPSSIVGGKVAAYALPPLQSFVGIIERPLFSPSRRPPATKPEDLGQIDTFALVGVVVAPGERAAFVEHGVPPILSRLVQGQTIEGWTVSSIAPERIVLNHGATQHELKLTDKVAHPAPTGYRPPRRR